jgi:G6PDH family F420-dependent oxidoreductase
MRFGYFLSAEECTATELLEQARQAEDAGFDALWISDHFHPWNDEQGQSPFVWAVIGALSQVTSLPVTTAVTCPTVRIHPAVIAQAAATAATMMPGRLTLGLGSGEALNEHILGGRWPSAGVRLAQLEEAVDIIRALWTGEFVYHRGDHYTVEDARIYSLPTQLPSIYISGFGPRSAALAGRIGDGYISTKPDAALIEAFRDGGGAGKPMQAGTKVCWSRDREAAIDAAHRLWRTEGLPGELTQVLPSPRHFEQASTLVTREMTAASTAFGNDPEEHIEAIRPYAEAGFDDIYISQMGAGSPGTEAAGFFDFYRDLVLPALRERYGAGRSAVGA